LDLVKESDLLGVVLNGADESNYTSYYHSSPYATKPASATSAETTE
jgi:hypothetical protein